MARNTNADFEVLGNLRLEFDEAQVKSVLRSASKMTDKEFQKTAIELGGFFERIMGTGAAQTGIQAKNYIRDLYGLKNLTGKQQALLSSGAAHAMGLRDFGKRKTALDKALAKEKQKDDEKLANQMAEGRAQAEKKRISDEIKARKEAERKQQQARQEAEKEELRIATEEVRKDKDRERLANQMADGREQAAKKRLDEENKAKQELLKKEQRAKLVAAKEEYQKARAEVAREKEELRLSFKAEDYSESIQKSLALFESQKGKKVPIGVFARQQAELSDKIKNANRFLQANEINAELKELKNLSKLSKDANVIAKKTQKELGIKKPGFFDKVIGGISLGSLGLGALAYKTTSFIAKALPSYENRIKETRDIVNAYGTGFDLASVRSSALLSGTNTSNVLKAATYAADVRGRMMTGKMSDSEAAALGFFSQYANVGFTGKGNAVNALKQDILNLKRSGVDISVIRSLLGQLGLSPELLALTNQYVGDRGENLIKLSAKESVARETSAIGKQVTYEANKDFLSRVKDYYLGSLALNAATSVTGAATGITTNNFTFNVDTMNATNREEGEASAKMVSDRVNTLQNASN